MNKINSLPDRKLDRILAERGIEITNRSRDKKIKDYKMWQAISNLNNVPDSLLIFCRLNEFANDLYRINQFEHEFDLIKRLGSVKEYNQRKAKLEEYLGMSKVKESLSELFQARGLQQNDPVYIVEMADNQFTPKQIIKADLVSSQTQFTPTDYYKYSNAMNEFKIRHHTIIDEVDKIYGDVGALLEELEQNVILGYLDRKELNEIPNLMQLNPDLIRVKEKMVTDSNEDATASKFKSLIELSRTLSENKEMDH
jgi:hypothetical protein